MQQMDSSRTEKTELVALRTGAAVALSEPQNRLEGMSRDPASVMSILDKRRKWDQRNYG